MPEETNFIAFPSIDQYRHAVRDMIYLDTGPQEFIGTVKLHGTNAAIGINPDGTFWAQSRNRTITPDADNMGFAGWAYENIDPFKDIAVKDQVTIFYGEWCGEGIQSGVAVAQLPKRFVVFAIRIDGEFLEHDEMTEMLSHHREVDFIGRYQSWTVRVDPANPALALEHLQKFTDAVENSCPYSEAHGANGVGEGIVWTLRMQFQGRRLAFKTKGDKHSVSKVKTIANVNMFDMTEINEFVDAVVTAQRLEQGKQYLVEMGIPVTMRSMGDFLRWIVNDVRKEEGDLIAAKFEGRDKMINRRIAAVARKWYMETGCEI